MPLDCSVLPVPCSSRAAGAPAPACNASHFCACPSHVERSVLLFGGLPSRCMLIAKSVPPARHGGRAPVPPCLPLASASSWSASASKSRSRAGLVAGRGGHLQQARRRANSPTRRQQRAQPAPPTRMATQSKDLVGPVPIPGRPVRADAAYGRAIVSPPRRGISASRRASWLQGFASWTLTGTKFDVPSNYRLIRAIGTGVSRRRVVCAGCRTSGRATDFSTPHALPTRPHCRHTAW